MSQTKTVPIGTRNGECLGYPIKISLSKDFIVKPKQTKVMQLTAYYVYHKTWLIMKLTIVLLIACTMQVGAKTYSQQISLSEKNAPLEKVIKKIELQSGFSFFYDKPLLAKAQPVTIDIKNGTLENALKLCFANQPLTYSIVDRVIVVKQKEESPKNAEAAPAAIPPPPIDVHGVVNDENGKPAAGVAVRVKATNKGTVTNDNGEFSLTGIDNNATLVFTSVNMQTFELKVDGKNEFAINLKTKTTALDDVSVSVNTGYQIIPKERATGSFVQIDNTLFNRTVSSDVLSRLNGITNGLLFDNTSGNTLGILIRGKSTIYSSTQPLIVVDNFPYVGDINNLNPNDIENVTVLKDAAAASIWGSQAGNGVIVITTKKGKLTPKPIVSFSSNITIGNKPDLYYQPQVSSVDFIGVEQYLFNQGYYNGTINNGYSAISPAVLIFLNKSNGLISTSDSATQVGLLKNQDIRKDLSQYFFRNNVIQQYNINISGGGPTQTYYFSAGYDKNISSNVGLSNDRFTINANNSYHFFNNKLHLDANIVFSKTNNENYTVAGYNPLNPSYPYEQLADKGGNPLPIVQSTGLNSSYTDTAGGGLLLDWKFRPLDELRNRYSDIKGTETDYRINIGARYEIIRPLSISLNYQYFQSSNEIASLYDQNSFYVRNRINQLSQIDWGSHLVTRPLPFGDILARNDNSINSNYGRIQLNFNKPFKKKHNISAIAGYEVRDDKGIYNSSGLYGYNPSNGVNVTVDNLTYFPFYYGFNVGTIQDLAGRGGTENKNISYYGNIAYSYDGRYIITGSLRKDESNLFGVATNQRGVPLGHFGLGWNVDKEAFYKLHWLSHLKFTATYGYNGLVNNSLSALLTSTPFGSPNRWGVNYATIVNPPNPSLRWERVKNINLGIEFVAFKNVISGTVEFYNKNGTDLIGFSPIAPQTGISLFQGNSANTHTTGVDVQINSLNVKGEKFNWNTNFIFNWNKNKVTVYQVAQGSNTNIISNSISPIVGYPINSIFAFKWAGLDVQGNPQGYLNKTISEDYTSILNETNPAALVFKGSAVPTIYGSLRNTFSYKSLEFSFNIIYKLGYYFRRNSLNYTTLFNGGFQQADYNLRWQHPGDELKTTVPSLIYPADQTRDQFYSQSEVLIEKGDQIRLQDIRFSYNFSKHQTPKLPLENLSLYFYVNNLGILWRANKEHLDPDAISGYPNPKTFSIGFKANF